MRVCVGGTFNMFHKGHELLIKTAITHAGPTGYLFIGVASGKLTKKKQHLRAFNQRKNDIQTYLSTLDSTPEITIEPITDIFGPTLNQDFDIIVVSPETKKTASYINEKRTEKGLKPLNIIEIPFVYAEDGRPIQSTRIINNEIDRQGNITQ